MSASNRSLSRYLPILDWARGYTGRTLTNDLIAAVIVAIILIPQSLAYALLAGLPPEAGLYASIVPIMLYAVFGTSRTLAVGPVAIVSLLTASAVSEVAAQGTAGYAVAALTLAFLSGGILLLLGFLRLGFLANFLSHPVIAGFIAAASILIAVRQLGPLMGISASGSDLPGMLGSIADSLGDINLPTLVLGAGATAFLYFVRSRLKRLLTGIGLPAMAADIITKAGPFFAVVATTLAVWGLGLADRGVSIVGEVPQGLPPFTLPDLSADLVAALIVPAILISIIGFVESVSVAQSLAAKKRQRIDPDQELIGLGAANLGAGLTGGFPVTGGFARSFVNFDAGAETPAAGAFTAIALAVAAVALTPLIYYLPDAALAATVIVAVLGLIDLTILRKTWAYSKADFLAVAATIGLTLGLGVEAGVAAGVILSVLLYLYKTSRPHVAEVGRVPDTEHFRNILRHEVETDPTLVTLRVDESLYFANARFLEDLVQGRVTDGSGIRNVVLMFSAVNEVDFSALESLEAINRRLKDMGINLHLSEVKGPVMDRLKRSHFLDQLTGEVFLSQWDAWRKLSERPS